MRLEDSQRYHGHSCGNKAMFDPLSAAAAAVQVWVIDQLNLVMSEHLNVSAVWFLGFFMLLGNIMGLQANT